MNHRATLRRPAGAKTSLGASRCHAPDKEPIFVFYPSITPDTHPKTTPRDLVDEAFLRRIRHKIEVGNPTFEQFREIFKIMCRIMNVPYDEQGLAYLLKEWYLNHDRDMRMVHPRDLLSQLLDIAGYLDVPPRLTKELIDRAAASYFVEL